MALLGKRPIYSVIEYTGSQNVFIWRHPDTNFNTKSQLVVREPQEAFFYNNGIAEGPLRAGRYTLDTQNIPFLRGLIGLATGGNTPFQCEVYYINKTVSMGISWGTETSIEVIDPVYGILCGLRSYGDYSLRVAEGKKLLLKLAGHVHSYTQSDITTYFSDQTTMIIRESIAKAVKDENECVIEINTRLSSISKRIKDMLSPIFAEYGLELMHFAVSNIAVDGVQDLLGQIKHLKIKELQHSVEMRMRKEQGLMENELLWDRGRVEAAINDAKDITEVERIVGEIGLSLSKHPGVTGFGIPFSATGGGGLLNQNTIQVDSPAAKTEDIVGKLLDSAAQRRQEASQKDQALNEAEMKRNKCYEELKVLKKALDDGLITNEIYKERSSRVLDKLAEV